MPKFFSDLIGDLRDEVWRLKSSGNGVGTEKGTVGFAMTREEEATEMLLMSLQDQLKEKNAQMAAMKFKYMFFSCVMFVFVVGKMLVQ